METVRGQLPPRVTLTGDRTGDYVVCEERCDGTIVQKPETRAQASLRRLGLRSLTGGGFDELDVDMQPADGEG